MTTPRYPMGCAAESKERRDASDSSYAWGVNFNNGNVNINNRNNNGFVRAVRRVPASECPGAVRPRTLFDRLCKARRLARRGKKPSRNMLAFDTRWIEGVIDIEAEIRAGTWSPQPTTCFVARRPKAREIHAPDFADRVVHHLLVPELDRIYEPTFYAHSYANRRGKGSHAAVEHLERCMRQVHSGQGGGWFLQLDIHNFFNSIHRPTLWAMLKRRLTCAGATPAVLRLTHALLRHPPTHQGVHYRATAAERALVPLHKQLANAAPGCGLPIGNLSSQFFANVYLDALDQFIKHQLKVPRYLRYVDDFVLVHQDRQQLLRWQADIERFLAETLRLRLKPDIKLARLTDGCDFLGYIVRPTHTLVRHRVIQHAREALWAWQQAHVAGDVITTTGEQLQAVASTWASYPGHFRHAQSFRLRQDFHKRYPWLHAVAGVRRRFNHRAAVRPITIKVYP